MAYMPHPLSALTAIIASSLANLLFFPLSMKALQGIGGASKFHAMAAKKRDFPYLLLLLSCDGAWQT
jgi:hypothetical protein